MIFLFLVLLRSDILFSQGGMGNIRVNLLTFGVVNIVQFFSVFFLYGNLILQYSMFIIVLLDFEYFYLVNGFNGSILVSFKVNVIYKDLFRLWSNEDVKLKKVGFFV